jgi:SNF2 family DNA or RNA helicase
VRITGSETVEERAKAAQAFRSGLSRICLLTTAGGMALNLQAFGESETDVLVMFDLPWDPGTWKQVIGRLHRIGGARKTALCDPDSFRNGLMRTSWKDFWRRGR